MLIDGRAIAQQIQHELKDAIGKISGRPPHLVAIQVGEHPPSETYLQRKTKSCKEVGITSEIRRFPETISLDSLLAELQNLNRDSTVDGILVQLPLPPHLDPNQVMVTLDPTKDVDGFHPTNLGKLLAGNESGLIPCTPLGIQQLLVRSSFQWEGKHVVILGRSNIVGKPLAALLLQKRSTANATVTVVHSGTPDPTPFCRSADILVAAMGKPKMIKKEMIQPHAIVIDVGISRIPSQKDPRGYTLVGDVDFEDVHPHCRAITPVPGGVGPMTVAMLLHNTWTSYLRHPSL